MHCIVYTLYYIGHILYRIYYIYPWIEIDQIYFIKIMIYEGCSCRYETIALTIINEIFKWYALH